MHLFHLDNKYCPHYYWNNKISWVYPSKMKLLWGKGRYPNNLLLGFYHKQHLYYFRTFYNFGTAYCLWNWCLLCAFLTNYNLISIWSSFPFALKTKPGNDFSVDFLNLFLLLFEIFWCARTFIIPRIWRSFCFDFAVNIRYFSGRRMWHDYLFFV